MKRAAVIGIGGIGVWHGTMIRDTNRIELAAVCDVNPAMKARAEEHLKGVPFYGTVQELLANEPLDVASVVVPHYLHKEIGVQLLDAGINVVVEKPMATNYADCRAMIEAAKRNNRFCTVFHNRRLDPWYLAAQSVIDDGLIGDPVEINVAINFSPTAATWRGYKAKSGGILYDWGAHLVDYALHLARSEVKAVSGYFYNSAGRDPELNEEHGSVRIYFTSGSIANITVSGVGQAPPHRYYITGTKGGLTDEWHHGDDGKLKVYSKLSGGEAVSMEVNYRKASWQGFYDNIADCLCEGKPLMVSAESAAKVIDVFSTAEKSWAAGGTPLPLSA